MQYSQMGEIARREIESDIRENMVIDTYVIMPNHIHAIIVIQETDVPKNHVGCDGIAPGMDNANGTDITPTTCTTSATNDEPKTSNISHTVGCDGIAPGTDNANGTDITPTTCITSGTNDVPGTQNISQTVGCDGIAPTTGIKPGIDIIPTTDISPGTNTETTQSNTGTMQSFPTLSRMIRGFKGRVTSQILQHCESGYLFAWQKSFYDVIIRNEEQLHKTRQYILDNPKNWESDVNYV